MPWASTGGRATERIERAGARYPAEESWSQAARHVMKYGRRSQTVPAMGVTHVGSMKSDSLVPGGVDEYIASCPIEAQSHLNGIRAAIREVAPDSIETVSYFQIPGYSYPGYDYNGMFAWFSYKQPDVRLHVRPPVIQDHESDLKAYRSTKSIVSFPLSKEIPMALVRSLVLASIEEMKKT